MEATAVTPNERLREYFQKYSHGNEPLDDDTPLLTSGLLDSLAIVKLLEFLDKEFGVSVGDVDFDPENFESVAAICALIERG